QEAGGITQHIGAYLVEKGSRRVTFIDTPGHQAFTEMRARGANVTDIAVIVVAADDGPMPQTEEAIHHARAAGVKLVVALNKVDRADANPQRAKEALAQLGLMPTEWHGDTEFVEVSAVTGQGLDDLLEILNLEAEILELKADYDRPALGVVLEAGASASQGVLATVLVQQGTLRVGDYVVCGASYGRVRNLLLNAATPIAEATPSLPVTIVGLNSVPSPATKLYVFENEKQARQVAAEREWQMHESQRSQQVARAFPTTREGLLDALSRKGKEKPELRLILRGDVQGTVETLRHSVEQLSTDEIKVSVLHWGVGAISQDDVNLAHSDPERTIIVGYNVNADERARVLAEEYGVEIRYYTVIYKAIEDIHAILEGRLEPEIVEEVRGHAEIRQIYKSSRVGNIAGCIVSDGVITRSDKVRLKRAGRVIFTGDLSSLKRFKDDVRDVREGYECGIKIAGFDAIEPGDVVEAFALVEKKRTL
ncbi:MAG: translation initiation factor IF-2, partial [Planctomycetes bacterium]|nr:translation initiation factor IF-2 [Planctomycetota bacterium]